GTLCIVDNLPRSSFEPEEQAKLERLARLASQALRARAARAFADRAVHAQEVAEARSRSILDEASEAFLACDRLALCVGQRLGAKLARMQACLERMHDHGADAEVRQLQAEAAEEAVVLRDLSDEILAIARFDGQAARSPARTYEPFVVLRDVVGGLRKVA